METHSREVRSSFFENLPNLKCLGMIVGNTFSTFKETKRLLVNSKSPLYYLVQNLCTILLSTDSMTKIQKTVINLLLYTYVKFEELQSGAKIECLIRRIFPIKGKEVTEHCRNCVMKMNTIFVLRCRLL
jgi:hypothetical protein